MRKKPSISMLGPCLRIAFSRKGDLVTPKVTSVLRTDMSTCSYPHCPPPEASLIALGYASFELKFAAPYNRARGSQKVR